MFPVERRKKVPPFYSGNDRLFWLTAYGPPAVLLPTLPMPEQMSDYFNAVRAGIMAANLSS